MPVQPVTDSSPPQVFISYSWSSPAHEGWVLKLASELMEAGIHAVLDKWDLRPGADAAIFMERMVNDPAITKVIMVCDRTYKQKADSRKGGAGTEAQILSAELYGSVANTKFGAVVTELNDEGKPFLPTYYASRIYVDMSDDTQRSEKLEELTRWIFGKPLHVRPELGKRPAYLDEGDDGLNLQTSSRARRALDAARNHKPFWKSALTEYAATLDSSMEKLRIPAEPNYGQQFLKSITAFIPYRNEALEVFLAAVRADDPEGAAQIIHRFFESTLTYSAVQENRNQWMEHEFDNYRFLLHELFLMAFASFLKSEQFSAAAVFIEEEYVCKAVNRTTNRGSVPFTIFGSQSVITPDVLAQGQGQRKISERANLITKRLQGSGLSIEDLAQADLILALKAQAISDLWLPEMTVYADRYQPLPIFARAKAVKPFKRLCTLIGVDGPKLAEIVKTIDGQGGFFQSLTFRDSRLAVLTGLDELPLQ